MKYLGIHFFNKTKLPRIYRRAIDFIQEMALTIINDFLIEVNERMALILGSRNGEDISTPF